MAAASQSDAHRREPKHRRPMCGVCTKPLRLCLCGRFRSPPVDTAVGVTVLQHAMEAHHPLNSTRVARLGLRNLAIAQVTDVNNRARFLLTTLGAGCGDLGGGGAGPVAARAGNDGRSDGPREVDMQNGDAVALRRDVICGQSDEKVGAKCAFEKTSPNACGNPGNVRAEIFCDLIGEVDSLEFGHHCGESFGFETMTNDVQPADFERPSSETKQIGTCAVNVVNGESNHRRETGLTYKVKGNSAHPVLANGLEAHGIIRHCNGISKEGEVAAAVGQDWTMKNMDKCTIAYTEKELRIDIECGVKPKIRWLSRGPLGQAAVLNGFVVTKIQTKKSKLTGEVTEFEEFSITIPPKSALLFPCQWAISIDASDCQVQHLIVLDGTWAKAQRMYHENPWLQLLPHVKLESDRVSLYSEVRQEPKAGCLSTIESIVVAMKKLGEHTKGLDDLLDVFESMIADQRRCKDENVKQKLKSQS
ncbi:uncharacterized protein LOC133912798 [Phragmites australis]|uniref:uncharacterized protein LOC133912798 n=1 Tax=Phragmites australis TaxID=29695 RepID=UPI002D7701F6|nr:uncharacterized protein LOC133912798 [Phragmites australis]